MKNSSEPIKYRHRIHELFSEERLDAIEAVIHNPSLRSNNDRVDEILDIMKDMEISMIGAGTNRMSVLKDEYIYKIALDSLGKQDNWTEFNMSVELQPYVTKTYECNGTIAVAEYVNLFSKEEFELSKENINAMLEILSEDYLFCDLSTTPKNFVNYGYRDSGEIVVLDYGLT